MKRSTTASFFDDLAEICKPFNESILRKDRIISLDYHTTLDKILVVLNISWHRTGDDINKTEVIVIEHNDFHQWLDFNERLVEVFGEIDDPIEYPLCYTEFMTGHVTRSDIQDYIISKKLAPNYEWSE